LLHRYFDLGSPCRVLSSARAPELNLPDLDGNTFKLSSLKGKKVLVYAWAPY
jgi:peroxiredoxin